MLMANGDANVLIIGIAFCSHQFWSERLQVLMYFGGADTLLADHTLVQRFGKSIKVVEDKRRSQCSQLLSSASPFAFVMFDRTVIHRNNAQRLFAVFQRKTCILGPVIYTLCQLYYSSSHLNASGARKMSRLTGCPHYLEHFNTVVND